MTATSAPASPQSRWFDLPDIQRGLAWPWRMYAAYCRAMGEPHSNRVRGGSFLLRRLAGFRRTFHLPTEAKVRFPHASVCVDFSDEAVLEVLDESQGINPQARLLQQCLRTGDTFLDIGANHGSYSLIAASLVGATGKVIAFEPQPRPAALIRRSFEENGMRHASVQQVACSDKAGEAEFLIPAASRKAGLFAGFSGYGDFQTIKVKTVKLDEAAPWPSFPGSVFIKLDAEGSEYGVLTGGEQLIRKLRPTILMELNPDSATAAGHTGGDILDLLCRLGYQKFSIVEDFPATLTRQQIDSEKEQNLVALP